MQSTTRAPARFLKLKENTRAAVTWKSVPPPSKMFNYSSSIAVTTSKYSNPNSTM